MMGKIVFIGAGNMTEAVVRGLLKNNAVNIEDIVCADIRTERLDYLKATYRVEVTTDAKLVLPSAEIVVLATKPQAFAKLLGDISGALDPNSLIVSVAAGVATDAIGHRLLKGTRIIRVMPNTPVLVQAGATAICRGEHATAADLDRVAWLFGNVGTTVELEEYLMDAVTGLSGSGPAYIFLIIEALSDAGVKVGLHRETAQKLAAQTVLGSAKMLIETGEHPGKLKDMVTSPGGTAIAGLHTLEAGGLRTTLINAVEAATDRAKQLGEQIATGLRTS